MYLKSILPQRLVMLRQLHGISQRQLARDTGIAASSLGVLESGFSPDLKLSTMLRLCERFAVTPDYLLGIEADPHHAHTLLAPPFHRRSNASGYCLECRTKLAPNEPHRLGQCILQAHVYGASVWALAARYGLRESSIMQVLRDE